MGVFADWQPIYAAYGISTFPVDGEGKRPLIRGYDQVDIAGSAKLVAKFGAADAFGFNVKRAGIVVVDLDTPDAAMLEEALQTHGPSPIIVQSAGGNFQIYYRHGGEGRHIRPWSDKPIDILGAGYVVAPPSRRSCGAYHFVRGDLDDLSRLTPNHERGADQMPGTKL
jgi:hypothetical protein